LLDLHADVLEKIKSAMDFANDFIKELKEEYKVDEVSGITRVIWNPRECVR
jgi:hypothetical protein